MIQESTILMTFHSELTRSFLHGKPFFEVPQPCLPGRKKHGTTAQFGAADLCGPRFDNTDWIRSDQKSGRMVARCVHESFRHSTNFRWKGTIFFHECSKPLEHGHDIRFFPNSMIVEELWLWKFEPNTARQVIWSTYVFHSIWPGKGADLECQRTCSTIPQED